MQDEALNSTKNKVILANHPVKMNQTSSATKKPLPSLPPSPESIDTNAKAKTLKKLPDLPPPQQSHAVSDIISGISSAFKDLFHSESVLDNTKRKTTILKKLPDVPYEERKSEPDQSPLIRKEFSDFSNVDNTNRKTPILKKLPDVPHEESKSKSDEPNQSLQIRKEFSDLSSHSNSSSKGKSLKKMVQYSASSTAADINVGQSDALELLWSRELDGPYRESTSGSLVLCARCKLGVYIEDQGDIFYTIKNNKKTNYLHKSCYKCFQCGTRFWNNSEITVTDDRKMLCGNCAGSLNSSSLKEFTVEEDDYLDPY
jgi:hypothetical protein